MPSSFVIPSPCSSTCLTDCQRPHRAVCIMSRTLVCTSRQVARRLMDTASCCSTASALCPSTASLVLYIREDALLKIGTLVINLVPRLSIPLPSAELQHKRSHWTSVEQSKCILGITACLVAFCADDFVVCMPVCASPCQSDLSKFLSILIWKRRPLWPSPEGGCLCSMQGWSSTLLETPHISVFHWWNHWGGSHYDCLFPFHKVWRCRNSNLQGLVCCRGVGKIW